MAQTPFSGRNLGKSTPTDDELLYDSFRANVPLRKIQVPTESGPSDSLRSWLCFDAGPKRADCPLVLLPPVCGRACCYFKQQAALASYGVRTVALEWPPYWNVSDLINGFRFVMDTLHIKQCHLFGASLGGFLAQKIAESLNRSLVLCNSFARTDIFKRHAHTFFYWALPAPFLKRHIAGNLPKIYEDKRQATACDFMIAQLAEFWAEI